MVTREAAAFAVVRTHGWRRAMSSRNRSWWGGGHVEEAVVGAERTALRDRVAGLLPGAELIDHEPPPIEASEVGAPRIAAPASLAGLAAAEVRNRLAHGHGQAFRDVARALLGELP